MSKAFIPKEPQRKEPVPRLTLDVSQALFDAIESAAKHYGISKSEFARQAMEFALSNIPDLPK